MKKKIKAWINIGVRGVLSHKGVYYKTKFDADKNRWETDISIPCTIEYEFPPKMVKKRK